MRSTAFIALSIPLETKEKIATLIEQLRRKNYPCVWTDPQQTHITLMFLGRISQERVNDAIKAIAKTAEGFVPFELKTDSINYFQREKRTGYQTLFIDVLDPERKLRELYKSLFENIADEEFFPPERLHPHITIGRLKKLKSKQEAQSTFSRIIAEDQEIYSSFVVDSINIYESIYQEPSGVTNINQSKTRYRLIRSIPLGKNREI
ncbi:MAG: RNA 2',3'-cyclic phosphodiesterase [Candidatus Blackburnbacteria bacterium]|nr:RNA 2',3'-cyclic phosphodiesterase [Candidatus Blackburnbacteria bacterium]